MSGPVRIDRRTTIKWMIAATASIPAIRREAFAEAPALPAPGYGTDPNLTRVYSPGDLWPLTFTESQRRTATALCDVVIPADAASPSASAVGVVDFLDEWISAPYAAQREDRAPILAGLEWVDAESRRQFGRGFADCSDEQKTALCDAIAYLPRADAAREKSARFFARFRDLTMGGFYTTPDGMRDIGYVGNVVLERFDGPPPEVLAKLGLAGKPA